MQLKMRQLSSTLDIWAKNLFVGLLNSSSRDTLPHLPTCLIQVARTRVQTLQHCFSFDSGWETCVCVFVLRLLETATKKNKDTFNFHTQLQENSQRTINVIFCLQRMIFWFGKSGKHNISKSPSLSSLQTQGNSAALRVHLHRHDLQ